MPQTSQLIPKSTLRPAVLILAAGSGSRLGNYPKALLQRDGLSLLEAACKSALEINPIEILVITGFYSDQIQKEIESINQKLATQITWVKNSNAHLGRASSVRLGIESLKSQYDVLLIVLSDQPNVGHQEMMVLIEEFEKCINAEILLPVVNGFRGNPVVFSRAVIMEILKTQDMACREYIDKNPSKVTFYKTRNIAYVTDVDTPEAVEKLGLSYA